MVNCRCAAAPVKNLLHMVGIITDGQASRTTILSLAKSSKHVERFPRSSLPVSISRWVLCQLSHGSAECHGGHFLPSLKVSWRSHPLCPRQPKSVTSDLWRQVWPLHRRPFGKPELAAGGNCSGLDKLQLAWPEAALPWCAAGLCRSVFAAACLAVSRFLATAGLFDGTQLHGTPARRDIPRRPSNLTFVAVPKLKRNTSR